jgi:hypothetical protein
MKQFIRKISAVGTSIAMLGMTVGGAVAADLADLPAPMVADGSYVSTAMVIGSSADTAARSTLKTYFDGYVESGSGAVTYNSDDDEEDDLVFNTDDLTGFGDIDSGMIDSLFEGEIEVNDTDYTAREVIFFDTDTSIRTSYHADGQEEFGDKPYMLYGDGSINYGYNFTDEVPQSAIDTSQEDMDLTFLGKDITIESIGSDNSVTLDITDTVSLDTSEFTVYKGHTVTLIRVYSTSAAIDVDGEEHIIAVEASKDFGDDITVEIDVVGESDDPTLSSAVLKLSEQGVTSSVEDGDAFELFEDYDTNSHSPWTWSIIFNSSGNEGLEYLGIENRWDTDDLEPSQDWKTLPITVGGSIMFPNDYASVVWDSVTTDTYADFSITIDDSRDLDDEDDSSDIVNDGPMVVFESADGDYFELAGADYHTVFLVNNATDDSAETFFLWGEDDDGYHLTTATTFDLKYNDDDETISYSNSSTDNFSSMIYLTANDWNMSFTWNYSNDYFGLEEGVDEGADLKIGDVNYGTKEYDILLDDGTIILNPDSGFGSDKLEFKIPNQDVEATFKVYAVESVGEAVSADLLTADEDTSGYSNLILVGGPAVNSVTASFMGLAFPSYGDASSITPDTALVKLVEQGGQTALIVAGWETADTLRGANAVKVGGLSGSSHVVA